MEIEGFIKKHGIKNFTLLYIYKLKKKTNGNLKKDLKVILIPIFKENKIISFKRIIIYNKSGYMTDIISREQIEQILNKKRE